MKSVVKNSRIISLKLVLVFGVTVWSFGCGGASTDPISNSVETIESRGQQIVDEYLKRDGSAFRKSRIRFTVTEEGEAPKMYEIESWRKQVPNETTTMTEIVTTPEGEDGARTLTFEARGKKTVVVTYAASRDEFRETDSKKMFFGGLTAGELLGDWDKFNYQFRGDKDLSGTKVFEVEGKLKPGADSIISRMDVFFRSDNYVPVESHLFGADGSEIRTYKAESMGTDSLHQYASRVNVDNIVRKTHVVIEVLSQEYPAAIDNSIFTREKLKEAVRK